MANSSPLALTAEIKALVDTGMDTGNIMLLAAVDADMKPVLSFRGSTAAYSDTQLSLWVRNTAGGTIEAIKQNPQVALMYRSQAVPLLQFAGRARIATDAAERERVFSIAHEREQKQDPERKGIAVIVELDRVSGVLGFGPDGPIFCNMARSGVDEVVRTDERREAGDRLEALLLQGVRSAESEVSAADLDGIRKEGRARVRARKSQD